MLSIFTTSSVGVESTTCIAPAFDWTCAFTCPHANAATASMSFHGLSGLFGDTHSEERSCNQIEHQTDHLYGAWGNHP